ncbi:MAG: indolepyruvate ferredoxin oxidoreductase subunit alpha [Clostridiales bacterium]|jgi:indolepyruvate ferredoxin oxidoreductase alpha subunit|nr:indolepyruvate ferredoxin oxidoreductase subunit alpha [Clostridiales bacterium]
MKKFMLGNEAVARGAYEAGVSVVSSYPGTPSTEITETIAKHYDEIYSEWAPNEKVALEVAIGASFAGARAMSCMKHVGLNVAADPLFTASYTGVNGGLVVCVADDQGMHSSQNEQDSRLTAIAAKVPMLEPADSAECKAYVKRAYELSEQYDTPVLLRLSTRISHSQSLVESEERVTPPRGAYVKDAAKYVMMPAMAMKRRHYVEKRLDDMRAFAEDCEFNRIERNSAEVGVIAAGIAYQYAKEVFPDASFLKIGMIHPLPSDLIRQFAASVKKVYVVEELDPVIENHCKVLGIEVIGKEIFPNIGEFNAAQLQRAVYGGAVDSYRIEEPIPGRPPVMCAGCPHRGTFYVLKKLGLVVSGDIGCYTLGALPPTASMDVCVCMGASVGMAHGMEKAGGEIFTKKTVAVIGDSTFIHSGVTGLINMAYNKGGGTVIVLDNSITGMTGHQDNPLTGLTIKGEPTRSVDLVKLCEAIGIERVVVADPFDLDGFERVVREETASDAPSVIIARRPCALLKNVKYGGAFAVNNACKNCKACMKLGCPAISAKAGGVAIDAAQCNGCGLCTRVCKFGAIGGAEA